MFTAVVPWRQDDGKKKIKERTPKARIVRLNKCKRTMKGKELKQEKKEGWFKLTQNNKLGFRCCFS